MADIKQAAKWLSDGRDVQRQSCAETFWLTPYYPAKITFEVVCADDGEHELDTFDLMAEDWQLCSEG